MSRTDSAFLREPQRLPSRPRLIADAAIGALIRLARRRKGFTLAEVGEAVGVGGVAVQHWESGRSRIPPDRMAALAAFLDIPASDLSRADHVAVTDQERTLLRRFRLATEDERRAALAAVCP